MIVNVALGQMKMLRPRLFIAFLAICCTVTGCTQLRVAKLDLTGPGESENYYRLKLGAPDYEGTIADYLDCVQNDAGNFYVHTANSQGTLHFPTYREYQSYLVWDGINSKDSNKFYSATWLEHYEFADAKFLFYDSRTLNDRREDTAKECYAFGIRDGKCVEKFHFSWNLGDLKKL